MGQVWLAGADAYPDGWVTALVRPRKGEIRLIPVQRFVDILKLRERPEIIAVDIPIGLPEHSELRGRGPEREVRPLLGPRRSSVFRVPSRQAVNAGVDRSLGDDKERYIKACAIARSTSVDGKAFGKQSFYLFPKIVEVDELLRGRTGLINRVYETHPELAFWRLNADRPLHEPKKRNGRCHEPGLALRRRLLVEAGFSEAAVHTNPPVGAGTDDVLDALACAAMARRIHSKRVCSFPLAYDCDAFGLPMAIWA